MKITKIKLENFALIYAARHSRSLSIDFSNSSNKIILIQGDNGTGKTSLLSNFHPFSSLGTLDLRNSNHLIIDGENGYKYIQYMDDVGNIYDIEHRYSYLKDDKWRVSSFFKMNGKELNPSGLVTTFNDIVKQYFGIDYSFLKIIRLGVNVNNLIKLRSAERKDFVSAILSDLEIYNSLFRVANNKLKKLRMRIKVLTENISKLNIVDENNYIRQTSELQSKLTEYNNKNISLLASKKFYTSELSKDIYNDIEDTIKQLEKDIRDNEVSRYDNGIFKRIEDAESKISEYKSNIEKSKAKLQVIRGYVADGENKIEELSIKIDNYNKENSEKKILEERLETCVNKREKLLSSVDGDIGILPTKDLLDKDFEYLSKIDSISESLLMYPADTFNLFKKYYFKTLNNLDETISLLEEDRGLLLSKVVVKRKKDIDIDCDKYKTCPFYQFYKQSIVSKSEFELNLQTIEGALDICKLFKEVINVLNSRNEISCMLPLSLDRQTIFGLLLNINKIDSKLNLADNNTNIETLNKIEVANKIDKITNEITSLENSLKNISSTMKSVLKVYMDELSYWKTSLAINVKESYKITGDIERDTECLNNITADYENMVTWVNKYDKYKESLDEYNKVKSNYILYLKYKSELENINKDIANISEMVAYLNNEITNRGVVITSYHNYKDELFELDSMFNDMVTIQEALSSTKGIPLLFMQLYFKGIQVTANSIIKDIYDDTLMLSDFIINDKEFTIPYVVNGVKVRDISSASQGETSIINLALSLAIIENFVTDYNILLLDEIDGALSHENKQKFFYVLDKQLEKINAQQVFVISHNELYNTYPCDVILTSRQNIPNGVNVIFKPED